MYFDPNVPYYSTKHTLLMIFAATMGIIFLLPSFIILLVYPTSLYRKISDRISPVWRIRIKTYVELFYGSVKDGITATKDYRLLSTLFLFVFGLVPQLVPTIAYIVEKSFIVSLYISATLFGTVAFLCTVLQPYKVANGSITGLLIIMSLMFGLSFNDFESDVWALSKCIRKSTQKPFQLQWTLHPASSSSQCILVLYCLESDQEKSCLLLHKTSEM